MLLQLSLTLQPLQFLFGVKLSLLFLLNLCLRFLALVGLFLP
jgi:hypothetical protein